ncbi:hypothetical protein EU527_00660 [Candidatus Thorarchaeota archaeon]|nr:MAG: hypothetical protein EU527_00660 [Candidatus Thorarchaeota archaeon]
MENDIERIIFVAVIHTDIDSVKQVREVVKNVRPEVVAVELDKERYEQLTDSVTSREIQKEPQLTGDTAHDLMLHLAALEKSLGDMTGSNVGDEMLAAIEEGKTIGAKIALVDRPIQETMKALMRVPLNELYGLINMLPDATKDIETGGANDLMDMLKEDGAIEDIIGQFTSEFPGLTEVLIHQRDQYVAKALHFILNDVEGEIVAVLGAGHIQGVKKTLEELLKEN